MLLLGALVVALGVLCWLTDSSVVRSPVRDASLAAAVHWSGCSVAAAAVTDPDAVANADAVADVGRTEASCGCELDCGGFDC